MNTAKLALFVIVSADLLERGNPILLCISELPRLLRRYAPRNDSLLSYFAGFLVSLIRRATLVVIS